MNDSDLALLALEIETLWQKDDQGRLLHDREEGGQRAPHLVIGSAAGGYVLAVGSEVPDAVAAELQRAVDDMPSRDDPATQPAALERCAQLLRESVGDVEVASGPSYLVPAGTAFESSTEIRKSDVSLAERWRPQAPDGLGWTPEEWDALLAGTFGPWAMATIEDRVASICHTPRLGDQGAEAGTWTHPDFRGRGYAAAATAAWAALFSPADKTLFYSTAAKNVSSQRVAARLDLPLIGWMWKLVHPAASRAAG